MSREASLQELLNSAIENQTNNYYTSIPCVVVGVVNNLNTQLVNIQPSINQLKEDGTTAEQSVIMGVPVGFPVSKTAGLTFPINVGDTGMAVFSMRSLEVWKSGDGYPSTPNNFAKMDKSDAVFYPIQPPNIAINNPAKRSWDHSTNDTVLVNGVGTEAEVEVRLKQNGDILLRTRKNVSVECDNAEIVANSSASITTPDLTINAENTLWTGNVAHIGTFTFNTIPFATHKHVGVQTGTGTSGTPVP